MPHGPLVAGALIQVGTAMIHAGIQRVIPEIAKLLDEPEVESAIKDLKLDKVIIKTLVQATKQKG